MISAWWLVAAYIAGVVSMLGLYGYVALRYEMLEERCEELSPLPPPQPKPEVVR